MLPVATACTGLAFLMGPATSYALEPFAAEAGVASALNGFVQLAGAVAVSLSMMTLPLAPRLILALVMMLWAIFAFASRLCSRYVAPRLIRLTPLSPVDMTWPRRAQADGVRAVRAIIKQRNQLNGFAP